MNLKTLVAVALLAPAVAFANGYSVPNVNARDLGMAGSLVAAQRDAAATFQNPAALAGLPQGLNLSLAASMLDLESTWTSADSANTSSMLFRPVPPPALYAAYGGRAGDRGWGVGLGLTIPAGGNVFWPSSWDGRFRILEVDRKVYGLYLTGGFDVIPGVLRVGGGPVYYRTTEKLMQKINFFTSEGQAELGTSGGKLSYDAAVELTIPGLPVTVGVDYKEQAKQELKGKAHFSGVPAGLTTTLIDQKVTHELTFPRTVNAGVAVRATKKVLLTASFTYDWYEVYKDDTFKGELSTSCPSPTCVVVPRNYGNGYTIRAGAEFDTAPQVQLRLGLLRDRSGLKTDTFSPTLPDGDTWAVTGGLTYRFMPNLAANVGVFYAPFDKVTVTGTDAFQGSYRTSAFIVSAGFTWNMNQ
jgi:long-chain fatty acid transport protein